MTNVFDDAIDEGDIFVEDSAVLRSLVMVKLCGRVSFWWGCLGQGIY